MANSLSQNNSINRYKIFPGITRSELALDEDNLPAWLAAFETTQLSKSSDKQPIVAFFFKTKSETFTRQSVRHKGGAHAWKLWRAVSISADAKQ